MRAGGVLLLVLGVLVLLAGLGMDTTETTTTCYEADYAWDAADSRGCVQTTYSNPAPKMAAVATGSGMLLVGGVLATRDGGGTTDSTRRRDCVGDPQRDDANALDDDSIGGGRSGPETFADKLRDHRNDE